MISAISIKPIIDETDRRMTLIKDDLIGTLEESINYEITYRSISPSIFSYISINDLVIYKDKEKNIVLAEIQSFKAFYSPFYFFGKNAGSTPLQAVKKFNVSNASFYINQERDENLLSMFAQDNASVSLLPLKTVFTGKNLRVSLETELGTILADDIFLTLTPENQSYKTRIDGNLDLNFNDPDFILQEFNSKISLRGTLAEYFESLNFTVKTKGLQSNILDLEDQTFQVISSSKELQIRKVQDNRPIDIAMRYDRELQDIIFTFNAEQFNPDSIVDLKGSLISFAPYAASKITGNGSFMFNRENSTFLYSLSTDININRDIFNRSIFIRSDLVGDKKQINVRSLDLRTKEGRVLFTGDIKTDNFFPSGKLTLKDIKTPYGYTINSRFNVNRDTGFLYLTSGYVDLGKSSIGNVDLVLFPENKNITASLKAQIIDEKGQVGDILADSIFDYSNEMQLNSLISIINLPMRQIISLIPGDIDNLSIPEDINDLSLFSDVIISTDFNSINAQLNEFRLVSNKNNDNLLSLSASYSDSGFKVNDLYLNWNDYNLNGYVNSNRDGDEYVISTHFDLQDKPYRLEANYKKGEFLFEGDYDLYGFLQKDKDGDYSFKINSTSLPVPILETPLYADLNVTGYVSNYDWKIYLDESRISTDSVFNLLSPEVVMTAEIDRFGCNFYNVQYRDVTSSLKGLGRLTYTSGDISSWLSLLDESGRTEEQYDLFFALKDDEIESRISIISTPLDRFSDYGFSGKLSADLVFRGTMDEPDINAVLQTDQMTYNAVPVEISSFIRGDKDLVRVSDLELNYNGLMLNRGLVLFELNKGKLLATAAINQNINNSKASTSLTALVTADNSFDIFTIDQLNTSQLDGKITVSPIIWNKLKTFPQIDIILKKDKNILTAKVDDGKILDSSYNLDNGDISLSINELFPLRLKADGSLKDSIVDVDIDDFYFDPGFINYFMPTDPFKNKRHVVFNGGNVTGDFNIKGKLSDPDFNGKLELNEILVVSPYIAEIPEATSTIAILEGKTMTLEPLIIPLHSGAIEVLSDFEFDGALPTTFNLDVNLTGSSGARVAYEIPKFSWDGHFTGYVRIEGSKEGGFLRGNLICNDLVSSLESSAEPRTEKIVRKSPSVNGFIIDLTIQTGRDVNFFFPNRQVPIIQATADNGDTMNIGYDSRSDVLALVGKVDIRTGEINYFNKTFYLQEGYIDFNESQVKFNPLLNVRADVKAKDELGDDVTISLLFNDYLLNEFNPEFLSFPRKTENEILALLGESFIPSNDPDKVSVASLLVATGGMIGKSTIMQPFEEAIKSSLQLDFVSFNTNIIENTILDRLEDQDLHSQDRQSMNFARYLENTSLFVGKYIGDYLFLEGSLVVDYDESNSISSTMGGLELNVNLNFQFITPFVLIDWSYNPKNNPGSEYFFPQNTITFTWQYSY